jgi:hypothetical protein
MRRISRKGVLACLMTALAWHGSAAEPLPRPGDGAVANGTYTNRYFDLSYPLPSGWTQGIAGPGPSQSGYYVLATFVPKEEFSGTILIAAQDVFFAATALGSAAETAREFSHAIAQVEGMTLDGQLAEVGIAGHAFSRVDFSGVGLYRSTFFAGIRCHVVSFNLTARSRELLATLALSLDKMEDSHDRSAGRHDPECIEKQAETENLLTKVDPAMHGPSFTPIPVRIIIGADGAVKNVHVISANAEQRDSIDNALSQWKFKPRAIDGRPADIETGLLIEFTSGGTVNYRAGDLRPPNGPL